MASAGAHSHRRAREVGDAVISEVGEQKIPRGAGQLDVHHVGSALGVLTLNAAGELVGQGAAGGMPVMIPGAAGGFNMVQELPGGNNAPHMAYGNVNVHGHVPLEAAMQHDFMAGGSSQQGAEPAMAMEDGSDLMWGHSGMEPNPGTPDAAGDREPGLEPGCESDAGEMPGILDEESLFTHAPIGGLPHNYCPMAPPPSPAPFAHHDGDFGAAAGAFLHQRTPNRGARMAAEAARATAREVAREVEERLARAQQGARAATGAPQWGARMSTPGVMQQRLAALNQSQGNGMADVDAGMHAGYEPAGGFAVRGAGGDAESCPLGGAGADEGDGMMMEDG